jgi:hypothetical protein
VTPVQRARIAGFNASIIQRGIFLQLLGSVSAFNALVQRNEPDKGDFSLSDETRDFSKIHILRSATGLGDVQVGDVFRDAAGGKVHRVTRIEDHPTDVLIIFHCETASD